MGRLDGKVALVSAAAGAGLGQAIARRLGQEGAHVVVTDAHERRTAETAQRLSREFGREVMGIKLDVRSQQDIDACMAAVMARHGRVDLLVNNAGVNKTSNVWETDDETWNTTIDVCLNGTFRLSRAVLPGMLARKSGVIINISSIAGWQSNLGGRGQAAYAAAKAGVMALTRATAAEVGAQGVRVNAIAPGLIHNEFLARSYDQAWLDAKASETVVGRMGQSDDVSGLAVFLASDEASFITGEVICVSGGWYMHP